MSSKEGSTQLDFFEKIVKKGQDKLLEQVGSVAQALFSALFRRRSKSST